MQDSAGRGITQRLAAGLGRARGLLDGGAHALSRALRRSALRREYAPLGGGVCAALQAGPAQAKTLTAERRRPTCIPCGWRTPECIKTRSTRLAPEPQRAARQSQQHARSSPVAVEPDETFAHALECALASGVGEPSRAFTLELHEACIAARGAAPAEACIAAPAEAVGSDCAFLSELEEARAEAEQQAVLSLLLASSCPDSSPLAGSGSGVWD